jgi:hypothetical protein
MGGARGRLLPLLRQQLHKFITPESFQALSERDLCIAYREVFPQNRPILKTEFKDHEDLIHSVCHSSMFPFFTSPWPVALDPASKFPRLVVDGYFAVPRGRFGCPDFAAAGIGVKETILVSVFPSHLVGINADHVISPPASADLQELFRLATQSSSAKELFGVYESGYQDAEQWCKESNFAALHWN